MQRVCHLKFSDSDQKSTSLSQLHSKPLISQAIGNLQTVTRKISHIKENLKHMYNGEAFFRLRQWRLS